MTTPLDDFETALLHQLRSHVTDRPRPRRGRRLLVGGAIAAAAAVAAVIVVPGVGSSPAYSVQEGNAGQITVRVTEPEDAAGLTRALAAYGIRADITYLPALQTCAPGRYTEVARGTDAELQVGSDRVQITLNPGAVRPDETVVFTWSVTPAGPDAFRASVDLAVASGPVAPCRPVPAR